MTIEYHETHQFASTTGEWRCIHCDCRLNGTASRNPCKGAT